MSDEDDNIEDTGEPEQDSPEPDETQITSRIDSERVARILVEASMFGVTPTCQKYGISKRTLFRYRARRGVDPQLAVAVTVHQRAARDVWGADAERVMKTTLRKLETLVEGATVEQLRDVTNVLKVLGDILITHEALGSDEDPGDSLPSMH